MKCFCATPDYSVHPRPGTLSLDDCARPKLLVCGRCSGSLVTRCGATREDRCEGCGRRHNRRLKRLIGSGFKDHPSGFFMGTGTAPGQDVLPWDRSRCNHSADLACSGKMGCKVEMMAAARWNACAPQVWSWMMTEIKRQLPGVDVQFWKCWETQLRGLLHIHAIMRAPGVSEKRMREVWSSALDHVYSIMGMDFEWGRERKLDAIGSALDVAELIEVVGLDPDEAAAVVEADEAAEQLRFIRYGAKYCTKSGLRASTVHRVTGEIRHDGSGYRTWSASARWGLTMKQIRGHQRDWIERQAADAEGRASGTGMAAGSEATLDTNTDIYAEPSGMLTLFDADLSPALL